MKTGYLGSIRPLVICCDTLVISLLNFVLLRFINFALPSKLSYATTSEFSLLKWSSLELVAYDETFKNSSTTHKGKKKKFMFVISVFMAELRAGAP